MIFHLRVNIHYTIFHYYLPLGNLCRFCHFSFSYVYYFPETFLTKSYKSFGVLSMFFRWIFILFFWATEDITQNIKINFILSLQTQTDYYFPFFSYFYGKIKSSPTFFVFHSIDVLVQISESYGIFYRLDY